MQMGIAEGVQKIAGGIENVLQRLRVSASNATVRLEVPGGEGQAPTSLVVLRVDELSYSGTCLACNHCTTAVMSSVHSLHWRQIDGLVLQASGPAACRCYAEAWGWCLL